MVDEEKNNETSAVTPMEKTPEAPASVVDPVTLEEILKRLQVVEEENSTLRSVVNQGKLTAAENAKKPAGLPVAYLKVLGGKVVTSWKSGKSQFIYNPSNPEFPIGEVLKATYFFSDGTDSGEIDQVEFTRAVDHVNAEIQEGLKGLKDSDVKEVTLHFTELISTDDDLKAKFVMPADIKINKNFLNP